MSRRRRLLALCALCVLVASSGCLSILTGGSIPDRRLDEAPPGGRYNWEANASAHLTVRADGSFKAVYRVRDGSVRLYRSDGFGGRNPLSIRAVRYRYPNGTVITGSTLAERGRVDQTRHAVIIEFPGQGDVQGDQLAFTAETTPKRFTLPTYVEGSYEVVLPPDRRVGLPVFGQVSPGGYETSIDDSDRLHIRWNEVTAETIVVQFYTIGDLRLLGLFVAVLAVIGVGGVGYYRYQIRELREQREELGLDVDVSDDDRRGPPPGMR